MLYVDLDKAYYSFTQSKLQKVLEKTMSMLLNQLIKEDI